jgi:hypothetical protein
MAGTVLSESGRLSDWLKGETEIPQLFSRDQITLANAGGSAVTLLSGTILGKLTTSGNFVQVAPAASDGSQTAAGLLLLDTVVPASGTAAAVAITRDAVVADTGIIYPAGATTNQKTAAVQQLAALGVITRRSA